MRVLSAICVMMWAALSQAYASSTTPSAPTGGTVIAAFGDSVFAGYELRAELAFPAKLQKALNEKGYGVRVIGHAVSGDTSADGLARVDRVLQDSPHIVILELGGNDLLRALPPEEMKNNLDAIIRKLLEARVWVILTGHRAPLNFGREYAEKYNNVFVELAGTYALFLQPAIMEGVSGNPQMLQSDGIHPNALGVDVIVSNVLPMVEQILKKQ